jgi:hypothetical protein
MSWSSALSGVVKFARTMVGGDNGAVAASVDGHAFTVADVKNGYAGLKSALTVLEQAAASPSVDAGFAVAEALEAAAADAGVPYASIVELVTLAAQFAVDNNLANKPGGQLPSWAGGDNSNPARGR